MKEVTYEEWQKNPTHRLMWVWDDEDNKVQRKVIYVLRAGVYEYPVLTVADESTYETFKHCAEIVKQRRMTNKELSRWLRKGETREFKYCETGIQVRCEFTYFEFDADKEVSDSILIREDDSDWREPLVEVEE